MNKKYIVRLLAAAIVFALLFIAARSSTTVERVIRVNADYYDVSLQLLKLDHYKSWYPGYSKSTTGDSAGRTFLTAADGRQLTVKAVNPSMVAVTEKDGGITSVQSITAIPLSNERQTEVMWSASMPWYKRISWFFTGRDNLQEGLINLKATLEDPALRYGFAINIVPVSDTIILTATKTSADSLRAGTLQLLYDTLQHYIGRNKPEGVKGYYYVTANPVAETKNEFAVGIPVMHAASNETSVEYLRLPATGRVLSGKAPVGKLKELYTAMNRYANDQGLQKVAQPLEKYDIEPAQVANHPEEEVELVFPIY